VPRRTFAASSVRWLGFNIRLPVQKLQLAWYARVDASHRSRIEVVHCYLWPWRCFARRRGLGDCIGDNLALGQRRPHELVVVTLSPALLSQRFPGQPPFAQADRREPKIARAGLNEMARRRMLDEKPPQPDRWKRLARSISSTAPTLRSNSISHSADFLRPPTRWPRNKEGRKHNLKLRQP